MLVLSRKETEQVVITKTDGTEIVVTVVRIAGNKVRIGFAAPDDCRIMRRELLDIEGSK